MIQDRTDYVKISVYLVRLMDVPPIELRERIVEAAMRDPNAFIQLFDPSMGQIPAQSLNTMFGTNYEAPYETTWRELAESSHFSAAVQRYHNTLHVNVYKAFQRVAEYCTTHGYFVPEVSNYDWQHRARCGEKINAIKEFRSVYRNILPWTGLKEAKDAVEAFISDEAFAS